jgi:ABC-type transport system substrate-binding protein/DNA-binding SARP family transcriptional activator
MQYKGLTVEFRILGPLEVLDDDRELALGPAKERAVLGVLLLHPGSVVSRTQLIDGLWGETPPPTAAKAVNVYVSQVRKTLSRNGGEMIETRPPGYVLAVDSDALDSARFERLARAAREREQAGEVEAAATLMHEALGLWRGPALAGIELEGEGREDVARLEELRLGAQLDLMDYELALGRHEQLLAELEPLVAQHPLDERLRGQLILALYRSGRQADALEAYRETRQTLVETLGIEPSAPLQRLERAILNHDPSLEAPAGTTHAPGAPRTSVPARGRRRMTAAVGIVAVAAVCAATAYVLLAEPSGKMRLAASSVGLIDGSSAKSLLTLPASARPVGLAAGSHSLWVTTSSGELIRADLGGSARASSSLSVGNPGAIAVAAGSVWMLEPDRGVVARIDPSTARVVRTIPVGNGPTAIAPGLGAVWITNETDGTLSRVDTARAKVARTIPIGQDPDGVAVGAGSVWVSDAGDGVVLRLEPADSRILASIPVGAAPGGLAFGGGSLWVADREDGTVWRIDPASNSVRTIPIGRSADGVAIAGGSVWAISTADGSLNRIDPALNQVSRISRLGSAPALLASSGRRLAVATTASAASHRGGTLRLIGGGQGVTYPVTLDPATWWTPTGWGMLAVTNDGLLTVRRSPGPSGLQIVPDLARAAPLITHGGTSYTFQLRPGMHYSNGHPVRARDVRASIERLWRMRSRIYPGHARSFATTVPDLRLGLVGEKRCDRAPGRCDLSRGIVTDDSSGAVTFRLSRPNPLFQRLLALPFYDVLPARTPARDGRPLPATGPYRIARYVPGRLVEAERNPRFRAWSTAAQPPGYPNRIAWRLGGGDRRALTSLRAGRSDYAVLEQPQASLAKVADLGRAQIENEPFPGLVYAFLNTRVPPFDNPDVRRALNLAVDRRIVARYAGGPLAARPTCQILLPSFPGYHPWCPYTFQANPSGSWIAPDLAAARALLRRSGTLGSKIVVWTPRDPSEPERLRIGHYLVSLLRALGYRVTLSTRPRDRYYDYVADSRHRAQIGIAAWIPDTFAASALFEQLTCRAYTPASAANQNLAEFCDARSDATIRRAEQLEPKQPAEANVLWGKADRRIGNAAPWIPLYTARVPDVLSRRVGNYQHNPMLGFLIDQAWVQ